MNPKDNIIQRAISNVKQTAGRIFQQAPQAANTYANAYQKVSPYVPFAPKIQTPQTIQQNYNTYAKPVANTIMKQPVMSMIPGGQVTSNLYKQANIPQPKVSDIFTNQYSPVRLYDSKNKVQLPNSPLWKLPKDKDIGTKKYLDQSLDFADAINVGGLLAGPTANGFRQTGSFSALADRKPRFEIPDNKAVLKKGKALAASYQGAEVKLGQIFKHDELYKNYPQLKDISVKRENLGVGTNGMYDSSTNTIYLNDAVDYLDDRSTLLHEIQHIIQKTEGFARGGSPEREAQYVMDRIRNKTLPGTTNPAEQGMKNYSNLTGEIEARAVQARRKFTPAQRKALDPYASQGVPLKDQIVRLADDVNASVNIEPNYTPITLKDGKVQKLQAKDNLKQLMAKSSMPDESAAQQRGRLMASEMKRQDPFIQGLEKDQAKFNSIPNNGGGNGRKPPNNGPQFTQADADQAAGRAQAQAESNYKGFQDTFAKFIGKRDAAKTAGVQTGSKFKDIPEDLGPDIIKNIESPDGQASPSVTQYSQRIRDEFNDLYKNAKDSGIEMGYLDNYITHIWDKPQEEVQAIYKAAKQKGFFQNDRSIPTYEEGIQLGLKPKYTTPQQILAEYSRKLEEVKANVDLFKQLRADGLVVDASVGAGRPGFEPITGPGFPRSFSGRPDGRQVQGFYFAPRDIAQAINKVFSPEPTTGVGRIFEMGKRVSGIIQDITLSGGLPKTPLNAFTVAQMTKEILAGRIKSPITSLIRGISKRASYKFFEENAGQIRKMQELNIPVSSNFDVENLVSKATINKTLGEKIGSIWSSSMNDPTFKRFMPMLQVNLFNDIEEQALKGGASANEAMNIAAQAVKRFYGITGTNITAQRNKIGQDILGTVFFAPKFRESMINFWVNNIKSLKNPTALENRTNLKFMVGATILFAGMNKLNQDYNNGKNMWENPPGKEDKLLIPLGNGTTLGIPFLSSIATLPRAGFKMAKNAVQGNFPQVMKEGKTFLSSAVRPPLDVLTNENYFGSEIYGEGDSGSDKAFKIGKYLLGQYQHPYIREAINSIGGKNSLAQSASQALELPIRFYKDKTLNASTYYAARDNAVKRLSPQEKAAFEAIPKYDANDPLTEMFKYQIYLKYPAVFNAKREIAVSTAQGNNVDPLYTVPVDIAKSYILYQSLPPGSQDAKDLKKANPQIVDLMNMRSKYFDANPIDGLGNESKRPKPSQYVQQQMDIKNWKDPEVRAYLDANTAYTNQERAKLGLTPLAGFQNYAKKPKAAPKLKKISIPKVKMKKAKIRVKMPKLKKIKIGGKTKKNKIRLTSYK